MSKVCGGGSWADSGCDREAGREASMADVPKDCVRAMVAVVVLLYCDLCGVAVRGARRRLFYRIVGLLSRDVLVTPKQHVIIAVFH